MQIYHIARKNLSVLNNVICGNTLCWPQRNPRKIETIPIESQICYAEMKTIKADLQTST